MNLRVAVVQMDFCPAVFVENDNLLDDPVKPIDGVPGHGFASLILYDSNANERAVPYDLSVNDKGTDEYDLSVNDRLIREKKRIRESYIELLNKKVRKILEFCIKHEVDIVVFPEYSIPSETLLEINSVVSDICYQANEEVMSFLKKHSFFDSYDKGFNSIKDKSFKDSVEYLEAIATIVKYDLNDKVKMEILELANTNKLNVVAGSHSVLEESYAHYKKINMPYSDKNDLTLRKSITVIFHRMGEIEYREKVSRTQRMDYDFTQGKEWQENVQFNIYDTKNAKIDNVSASVHLCIDFLVDKSGTIEGVNEQSLKSQIMIILACTSSVKPFEKLADYWLSGFKKPLVFANSIDEGGSRVFCHFDPTIKQQLYNTLDDGNGSYKLPKNEEGLIIVDLNVDKQFSTKPTSYVPEESSIQKWVYPFIYSYSIVGFEDYLYDIIVDGDNRKERIRALKDNERKIRELLKDVPILREKISRLYHNIDNLRDDQLDFFLGVFYLEDDIDTVDDWRLKNVIKIEEFLGKIMGQDAKTIKPEERERIYKMQNYYVNKKINLQLKKSVDNRQQQKKLLQLEENIVWVSTDNDTFSQIIYDQFKKNNLYKNVERINSDLISKIVRKQKDGNSRLDDTDILIIIITKSNNPFDEIRDKLDEDAYARIILVMMDDAIYEFPENINIIFFPGNKNYAKDLNQCIEKILRGEVKGA